MTIKLYNTKTRAKETLAPIDPQNVRMYVCGPTVYDRAHLGNARPAIVFDVLYRLLRHTYGADHVTYVRNFTDVDDKINARAARDGKPISEITAETTQWYLDDMAAVGVMEPNHMPRATEYIPQMIAMIEDLIAKGHAYAAEGHVLFAVDSYKAYGALSGRSVDDMIAGARVEVAPYKRNPMDFVLWKPSDADTPGWDSPWGRGRPGWHIECSAMSYELLGESFDIHGGGNDLMFPHHENEIAQSCCAHPEGGFAKIWLHNEMLQVEGKKMSKSLGNFFTVRDLLDQGVPGEVIRFVMLSTHYRKPMDWTEKKAKEAEEQLHSWRQLTEFVEPSKPSRKVVAALSDDLNTWEAYEELKKLAARKDASTLKASANLLGLLNDESGQWSWKKRPVADFRNFPEWHPARVWLQNVTRPLIPALTKVEVPFSKLATVDFPRFDFGMKETQKIVDFQNTTKAFENFSKVAQQAIQPAVDGLKRLLQFHDRLRQEYPSEMSLVHDDTPFSMMSVENMEAIRILKVPEKIEERVHLKQTKNFAGADQVRDELERVGVVLIDTSDGTRWTFSEDFDPSKLEGLL